MSDELRALHAGGDARDKGKPLRGVPSNCYAILEPRWVRLNPSFPCKGRKPLFCLGLSSLGGDDGIRTHDPLLAGQVLSQLSYTPIFLNRLAFSPFFQGEGERFSVPLPCVSIELSSHTVSHKVFSPLQSLTSVFGMGTGGPSAFVALTIYQGLLLEYWTTSLFLLRYSSNRFSCLLLVT